MVTRTVDLGVEDREVLADDLLGCVALQPPRAGVPGLDVAVAVEQEDRVVDHRLDEQAELVGPLLVSWRSHARWTRAARSPRGRGRRARGTAGVEREADAGGRAGEDQVAGLERDRLQQEAHEILDPEDQVRRVRVLAQVAVDPGPSWSACGSSTSSAV
jgi:hypothetical protein